MCLFTEKKIVLLSQKFNFKSNRPWSPRECSEPASAATLLPVILETGSRPCHCLTIHSLNIFSEISLIWLVAWTISPKNVECKKGKQKVSEMKEKFEKGVWSEFQVVLTITIVVKRIFWRYLRNCDCEQMWQVQSRCGRKIGCKYGDWVGIDCPQTRKISKKHYFSNQGRKFLLPGCLILHLQCVTLNSNFA